ncbi:uncharacterized protein [Gossypium hirsutum]|uniref:Uncharacterized protein n=1 Tax=Gossypium hirsutum TaxID=3635 RepID=A0A1U8IA87_GOSHI|nr:uncharacterized protein LOC107894353 [Gossypium hirsutum]
MSLVQGDRSVAEYKAEFLRLSRYARVLVASDYDNFVRFEEVLRYDLRVLIAPQRKWVFAILIDKAKIMEEVKRTEREQLGRKKDQNKVKRNSGPFGSSQCPKKRERFDRPSRAKASSVVVNVQYYGECGKGHPSECWRKLGVCLRCGLMEHRVRDCPRRSVSANCDRDSGSEFCLASERGQTETCQSALVYIARRCDESYDANAIAVSIDRITKRVTLRPTENDEVVIVGESQDYLFNVISALVTNKLVQKGCETYLAYVSNSTPKKLSVKDIRTVREFPNVFPEEFLGIPPEVEFEIDLLPEYHPGKANVVVDALSRRAMTDMRVMFAHLSLAGDGGLLVELQVKPSWVKQIRAKQLNNESLLQRL